MRSTGTIARGQWPASGQRAAVVGLGFSGVAAIRLLRAHGVEAVAIDRRGVDQFDSELVRTWTADPGITLQLGADTATSVEGLLDGVVAVVASPGVAPDHPVLHGARARALPVIAEVELSFRHLAPAPGAGLPGDVVIGITGSNGKSTTTAMAGALLRAAGVDAVACGNLGPPFADAVMDAGGAPRTYVVELSSFQLESVDQFRPRAAALLNLSPDHIDRHGTFEAYQTAKAALLRRQGEDDVAVLNADDPRVASIPVAGRRRLFSRRGPVTDGCYLDGDRVFEVAPDADAIELFAVADLAVEGTHNLENAMAAALLARSQAASGSQIRDGLRRFRGLPHRVERVADRQGVSWFDDSKGTNVGATVASLEGFADASVHLILGGRAKDADFVPLMPAVARKVRRLYLIGEAAQALADAALAIAPAVPVEQAETLARAVALAASVATPGQVVLLSPACASFDQFESYIERGRAFQRLVAGLDQGADAVAAKGASHGP